MAGNAPVGVGPSNDAPAKISTIGRRLEAVGVPALCFDEATYLTEGLTDKMLSSLLHDFKNVEDDGRLHKILDIGIEHRHFTSVAGITPSQFYKFLAFLRSANGQIALKQIPHQRTDNVFSPEQIGWISMFESQLAEFTKEQNTTKKEYGLKIAKLEAKIRDEKAKMEVALAGLDIRFAPAARYVEMESAALNRACWAEYLADCRQRDVSPQPISAAAMNDACRNFSGVVRQRHILDYVAAEDKRAQLKNYAKGAVGRFDSEENKSAAKRFRGLLAAVGAEKVPAAAAGKETATYRKYLVLPKKEF